MDDQTLVEEARHGNRDAFETLVKRYEKKVFHLAYGFVQDRAAADDLAQDIFVKVYLSLSRFHFKSEFGTWLYRVAVNHVKDHLRKVARRKEISLEEFENPPFAASDGLREREAEQTRERRRAVVLKVLETLPSKYRMILTLRDIRGLSYDDIAASLNVSPGTVDSRLHRARKVLLRKMTPYLSAEGGSP
jgi:RNA polymerase sigma-70 factor, ECF subfamily